MKKKIILSVLMATMITSMVACGSNVDTEDVETTETVVVLDEVGTTVVSDDSSDVSDNENISDMSIDFSGTYFDGDPAEADDITFIKDGDGTYNVSVGIVRLCAMDGSGHVMDDVLEIEFIDPNGNPMQAVFMKAEDGTYTLRIVESTWELLESGTEYSGFSISGAEISSSEEIMTGLANPYEEVSEEEMTARIGFYLGIPENATNLSYVVINGANIGQVTFDLDGYTYTARVKATADYEDISGYYYDWTSQEDINVSWCEGKYCRYEGEDIKIAVCTWCDIVPGVSYSLSVEGNNLDGVDIVNVANQVFVPMQGDS